MTGGSGLLGSKVALEMSRSAVTVATYHKHPVQLHGVDMQPLDITDAGQVADMFQRVRPEIVVHCAACVDVDLCESDREMARLVNVQGTMNIASAAKESGAKLVFISSDYIFDGSKGTYTEDDGPSPVSFYGETKAEGERIVRQACPDSLVGRLTVVYGWPGRRNFVTWVVDNLRSGKAIKVATDQIGNPTLADSAAESVAVLLRAGASGVFNISGRECISRFGFALKIADVFGLDRKLVGPCLSSDLSQLAQRPARACLDVSKAVMVGCPLPNIEEGLIMLKSQMEGDQ